MVKNHSITSETAAAITPVMSCSPCKNIDASEESRSQRQQRLLIMVVSVANLSRRLRFENFPSVLQSRRTNLSCVNQF